ncbi:hypothetical protein SORBI_3001G454200 [Sorghum bicolor]|uniref:Uncharacterized protein n=1 Tax=Sorghum bicolor TaxID=4558 RepID=A0A1B6QPK0_SORBI|nr:hypothetical protein SORBI_3001G454200 [Sorghum bicolor]
MLIDSRTSSHVNRPHGPRIAMHAVVTSTSSPAGNYPQSLYCLVARELDLNQRSLPGVCLCSRSCQATTTTTWCLAASAATTTRFLRSSGAPEELSRAD